MEPKIKSPIKPLEEEYAPLAFRFSTLAKKYYGVASKNFHEFGLERNLFILSLVGSREYITQQCLANCMDIDKAAMVRIIDYLSEKGLVKREVNPEDRREHIVKATPKAQKLIPRIRDMFRAVNDDAFKGFTKEERQLYMSMNQRMLDNLGELPSEKYQVKYIKASKKK